MTFRLTGLSTGTLYNVSVTAVDTEGNESACSAVASAIAQLALTVSPTGTLNFGSVNLGSVVDQPFTVQNTRSGAVSGAASTSAPFSIVAGSPFTLGAGSSQTVTVRFSPTVPATATVNVNFTADGDSISRIVTGTGIALDATPPTVAITAPTSGATYSTSNPLLRLEGTASDNVGVTQVTWANNNVGSSGTATGTTSWTASGIVLRLGANVLTVTASDAAGNRGSASLTATLTPFTFEDDPLTARGPFIRAVHIMELRAAIDSVRAARGLAAFAWTDPTLTPGSTLVSVIHLVELRSALNEASQAAGQTLPIYTDPILEAGVTVIKATHLNELRAVVLGLQ